MPKTRVQFERFPSVNSILQKKEPGSRGITLPVPSIPEENPELAKNGGITPLSLLVARPDAPSLAQTSATLNRFKGSNGGEMLAVRHSTTINPERVRCAENENEYSAQVKGRLV